MFAGMASDVYLFDKLATPFFWIDLHIAAAQNAGTLSINLPRKRQKKRNQKYTFSPYTAPDRPRRSRGRPFNLQSEVSKHINVPYKDGTAAAGE